MKFLNFKSNKTYNILSSLKMCHHKTDCLDTMLKNLNIFSAKELEDMAERKFLGLYGEDDEMDAGLLHEAGDATEDCSCKIAF